MKRLREETDVVESESKRSKTEPADDSREARKAKWASIKKKHSSSSLDVPVPVESQPSSTNEEEKDDKKVSTTNQTEKPNTTQAPDSGKVTKIKYTESYVGLVDSKPILDPAKVENDMFADSPDDDEDKKENQEGGMRHTHVRRGVDAADDVEGYYVPQLGELLANRYHIVGVLGKGVFSVVLKAKDLTTQNDVAIKLLRNNDYMKRTGLGEVKLLERLNESDPESKFNVVKLIDHFHDRDHLCLVFESMDINLRQLIRKYGKESGLGLDGIRAMAFMILRALYLLKVNDIVHADFKPDNMLVSHDRKMVKVADLGCAFLGSDMLDDRPYLVSRFYRAPEIILGLKFDHAIDMFAYGCCLYEFATGKPLFQSRNNNHHIRMILEARGMLPRKLISKGKFSNEYFDQNFKFIERSIDVVTGKEIIKPILMSAKPSRNISKEIQACFPDPDEKEKELVKRLVDLIEKSIHPDPTKRITPEQAMEHPFFQSSECST
eukprot:TRINITY_DN651_c0_g1_i7.p1 TRINITY_DN651_c0_g1~~TRINITY_DN651_c0_g1_i7.p1  ORF type:complete len:493 (+),score=88.38 TRINITY_DN651_c0_g1_i7:230-1708(+)